MAPRARSIRTWDSRGNMNEPLKLTITVNVQQGMYVYPYMFEAKRTLLEHTSSEINKLLVKATEIINQELKLASFLKGHLAQAASETAAIEDKIENQKTEEIGF